MWKFKNCPKTILLVSIATIIFISIFAIPVFAACTLVEQVEGTVSDDSTTWEPKQIRGQIWTASSTYKISYIEIYVNRAGTPGDINLLIQDVPGDKPSGNNLIPIITLPASSIPLGKSWIKFNIPNLAVNQGKKYWWAIYASKGGPNVDEYGLLYSKSSIYAYGYMLNCSSGQFQQFVGYDDMFRICGEIISKQAQPLPPVITPPPANPVPQVPQGNQPAPQQQNQSGATANSTGSSNFPGWIILVIVAFVVLSLIVSRLKSNRSGGTIIVKHLPLGDDISENDRRRKRPSTATKLGPIIVEHKTDHTCPKCDGQGVLECGNCSGKGWYFERPSPFNAMFPKKIPCKDCDGEGIIECPFCHGVGYV